VNLIEAHAAILKMFGPNYLAMRDWVSNRLGGLCVHSSNGTAIYEEPFHYTMNATMKLYLSSTYKDLKDHRAFVAEYLRKNQHQVIMMEEYVARDQLVEFACQGDVDKCDVYIGIFAWRHGHVPADNNPHGKSVTEMEYAAAEKITRLLFLLDDTANWPDEMRDQDVTKITALRTKLKKYCAGYFSDAKGLALEVISALHMHKSSVLSERIDVVNEIRQAEQVGPSYIQNLTEKLNTLRRAPLVEIEIGTDDKPAPPWWNTRLYLLAALADEVYHTRGFVFVEPDRRFLMLAEPQELRYRLKQRWPALEEGYQGFRKHATTTDMIVPSLWNYPMAVQAAFGRPEKDAIDVVTAHHLTYELGISRNAEVVDLPDKNASFLLREVVGRHTPYVAMLRGHELEGFVDRDFILKKAGKTLIDLGW
jgi:hypothetical protein